VGERTRVVASCQGRGRGQGRTAFAPTGRLEDTSATCPHRPHFGSSRCARASGPGHYRGSGEAPAGESGRRRVCWASPTSARPGRAGTRDRAATQSVRHAPTGSWGSICASQHLDRCCPLPASKMRRNSSSVNTSTGCSSHDAFVEDFGREPVVATRTLRVAYTARDARDLMSSRDSPAHEAFVR
jgi:hypothetical protein